MRRALPDVGPRPGDARPRAAGRFLFAGERKLWLRGVTYGTFSGGGFGTREQVERDLAAMATNGVNALRTYVQPPRWLLDAALRHGLWVLAGTAWEQHVTFLDDRRRAAAIVDRVRAGVAACAGHPALLGVAVGNEIPAPIVRWSGRRRVERFLGRLCDAARAEDAGALITYANYPSTEYVRVPNADFVAFNVYLEDPRRLDAYLARLHNVAGDVPLVLTELGTDSRRHGLSGQAAAVRAQIASAFGSGCAGAFVFGWTDEWHRGGAPVLDWDFGLTDRRRRPKPALAAAQRAFATAAPAAPADAPRISVVVCTYNGAATLPECLQGATSVRYPDYEVIVVDDGSTDASAAIATEHDVKLIRTPNRGLSAARNAGLAAAEGEIVAYLDDDARPDPDWLTFLAAGFADSDHAGIGGPNLPPEDESPVGRCVANAPGGPVHVLLSDTVAEHIPGCNMAFRRSALAAIGGFDAQFRVAGDDVDVCWRLQAAGHTLGYHPAALVWHRRRATLRRFFRQQRGYGRAEALLERKWPEKYNVRGDLRWAGRLYGAGGVRRSRIYHGTWGSGAFQPEVHTPPGRLLELAATPEWYLLLAVLAGGAALAPLWRPLLALLPLLVAASAAALVPALRGARRARLGRPELRAVVAALHVIQPVARLSGRLSLGLAPWRLPRGGFRLPRRVGRALWFERPRAAEDRVRTLEERLRGSGIRVIRGGAFDRWDLEVSGGPLAAVRLQAAVEEHGGGHQLMRVRAWPRMPRSAVVAAAALAVVALVSAELGALLATALSGLALGLLIGRAVAGCGRATAWVIRGIDRLAEERP
jgi:GT2 family glycosyltransferase